MSGKPASVGASRAGVPGTPRVVVYVADPRQLEPGAAGPDPPPSATASTAPAAPVTVPPPPLDTLYIPENIHHQVNLPRNTVYRTQIDRNDQRNLPGTIYYKHLIENDSKVNVYGSPDNISQRTEFYPVSQQYIKETCSKSEDSSSRGDRPGNASIKRDSSEQVGVEFNSVETFHTRIPVETVDLATYQARCSGPLGSDNTMSSMHPTALRNGQNQYSENITIQSVGDGSSCSERELSVCKSFVNYQFLEQSVSHQSIVNQSISILNQQVGVSRGIVSEGDSGNAPHLVQTADGVVLAVLPAPVLSHPSDNPEQGSRTVVQSDSPQTITVPLGWKRIISGTSVLYVSPSGTALSTLPQLRDYLQTAGTCKCGLPCPLRPETAFSFDSKVVSKPYQAASGAELTKLCNHKRKLLTTLQARAQSPATPPPQNIEQKKVSGSEVSVLKKKMKKRPGFPANVSVSQLMVQRERPLNEFKPQETDLSRESSTGMALQRSTNVQPCMPSYPPVQQNVLNTVPDTEIKQETHVQRSAHYLTVNSGWISQHPQHVENLEAQAGQKQSPSSGPPLSVGMPVLGTNGQIIGVNTGLNKQPNNFKNISGMSQNISEPEIKEEKKDMSIVQQNMQGAKYAFKEEEPQVFCGLNQALTPEVMQKINEQQQIFIQQNQKQIEMAMKGYRTQLAENMNQNKPQGHNQFVPHGQLVIQNGAVVKTNPAKTPPWQVKRNETCATNSMTSPSSKLQKAENDYEESNNSISEDSSSSSYSSFSSNEQINQGMCSRVPPLPQHYNMMGQQWPAVDSNKKKAKNSNNKGGAKKKNSPENKVITFGANGMRMTGQDSKGMNDEVQINNVPSFMDDPSGYLAQQTVLLNNTISKQVGINSSYEANQYENSNSANSCVMQNQIDKLKSMTKPGDTSNAYRNNVPNPSQSPTSTPDSSVLSEKPIDNTIPPCCKGCNVSMKSNSPDFSDNQMRLKYMKHHNMYKMEMESNSSTSSPKHSFEDNPVTSSTFIERSPMVNDNCGPIQAATVSTSNVSITETLQPPEPSPTLSNSSRSTDTPHSNGSNSSQMQPNCTYPMPSPAYSNSGSCRDNFSNPSTPGSNQVYPYNSPGPPNSNQSMTGTQVMHFISNHNVNKNLMEVDNISMVGVKPGIKPSQELLRFEPRRRIENAMPGYCPPPHLGGGPAHTLIQACYVQTFVTTMASGFSVTRDTVTSVLAGKANTATTSINASQANFIRPPPPPSVNLATTYAIPNNQPDPFINSVNLPTSYPLHIAGTTAQNMISKSPLEMVQNVIGSLPSKPETSSTQTMSLSQLNRRACSTTPGQILISSTGQIMVSNNQMPPPPPKTSTTMASIQGNMTNVTTSVTQVVPAVGGMQPLVNQPTVVVNTLPAPFVIQPPMMAVDGQVMQQNTVLPQIVTGGIVSGQSPSEGSRQIDMKNQQSYMQGVAMLSPESMKKRSKKKKSPTNITNVLQITAPQQNPGNIMVHHSSPQHNTSPQFSPRGFQLSPNNNISPTPMLQALTIVPGKSGTPAHIVMNGQGNTSNFGSQQIITNNSPSQQINLLQPVNLINNASSVVPNFPAFQQFIVPNIGGMVMTADGTAIIPDNSTGMPVQLQLQTVNGQNVLTPVQNPGVFAASTNGGVVLRAQNQQGKIIQSQHSPGAQFISPNSQVMMNSPNFNGQLSPLLANLSPTNVAFNTNPQVRSGNVQTQEFIQTNQMGQALMVPMSPKQVSLSSASSNRSNSTFVHQNTTIVQQQTTLVSNSHNSQMSSITTNLQGGNASRISIDPNILLANKPMPNQKGRNVPESPPGNAQAEDVREDKHRGAGFGRSQGDSEAKSESDGYMKFMNEFPLSGQGSFSHVRHSVSTQTLVNQQRGKSPSAHAVGSPPDTTTHSPLGALEAAGSPRLYAARCLSTQANYADTTTKSPEPADASSSAMVQCVSSSEQDIAESRDHVWPVTRNDFNSDTDTQSMISNTPMMRQNRSHNPVESTDMHFNQNMSTSPMNSQQIMPMTSNFYERSHNTYKRKNDFAEASTYRPDKIMRTNNYNMVHGHQKETDYESMGMSSPDKTQSRHFPLTGTSSDTSTLPKVFDRHNLGSGDDTKSSDESEGAGAADVAGESRGGRRFSVGDLVWGPVKGYASWPGKLRARAERGRWWVRWFGADRAAAAVPQARLLTLCEGLEAHHAARTKHRKSRKLNTLLENAIQEAMAELDKKTESVGERDNNAEPTAGDDDVMDAPRRNKKLEKARNRDKHHKKNPAKISPSPNTSGDGTRLRSSR